MNETTTWLTRMNAATEPADIAAAARDAIKAGVNRRHLSEVIDARCPDFMTRLTVSELLLGA